MNIPIMTSKMNFAVCVLLFIYHNVHFCLSSEDVKLYSNPGDLNVVQLNVTSTSSSFDMRSGRENKSSTDVSVSLASDNITTTKPMSGRTNSSENDMAGIILARETGLILKRIHEAILSKALVQKPEQGNSEPGDNIKDNSKNINESNAIITELHAQSSVSKSSEELSNSENNKRLVSGRQFLFHPYLPYGKEVMPDEKISFHDVLPIKIGKFIKGMVEDAPWEQMFMKMVRMVVDQFVDKIIEKMFSHDDEHEDKWRSADGELTPTGNHPELSATSIVRLRRSAIKSQLDKEDDWGNRGFSTENRLSKADNHKEKGTSEDQPWLDSILDYLFPENSKSDLSEDTPKTRRKKDVKSDKPSENLEMPDILNAFFVKLYELQTGELASEQFKSNMKKVVRHQMLCSVLNFHTMAKSNSSQLNVSVTSESPRNSSEPNSGGTGSWRNILKPQEKPEPQEEARSSRNSVVRLRRSAIRSEKKEDLRRLWQASRRSRPVNLKAKGECSLRRACNTGRLLARLPSVKDITLQLKSYGKEPHWDALVWGMTKKKCSKIFCKRQRSPKGSQNHWDIEERRHYRNSIPSTRSPRFNYDESGLALVSSLL